MGRAGAADLIASAAPAGPRPRSNIGLPLPSPKMFTFTSRRVAAAGAAGGGARGWSSIIGERLRGCAIVAARAWMTSASRRARATAERGCHVLLRCRTDRRSGPVSPCLRRLRAPLNPSRFIDPPVDRRDLLHPLPPLGVLQVEHLVPRPVEVVRNERYLLVQQAEGVADHPPRLSVSTSNSWAHFGHATRTLLFPYRLMRLYSSCRYPRSAA